MYPCAVLLRSNYYDRHSNYITYAYIIFYNSDAPLHHCTFSLFPLFPVSHVPPCGSHIRQGGGHALKSSSPPQNRLLSVYDISHALRGFV